jgi:hypothetical protein
LVCMVVWSGKVRSGWCVAGGEVGTVWQMRCGGLGSCGRDGMVGMADEVGPGGLGGCGRSGGTWQLGCGGSGLSGPEGVVGRAGKVWMVWWVGELWSGAADGVRWVRVVRRGWVRFALADSVRFGGSGLEGAVR